ncbi:MAG: phosphoribosyltransferase, partial [Ktedonobacteraceae bacterium]
MNMSELFPQFKEFLESEVLSQNYDFIIPIESKGALVLNEVISSLDHSRPKIMYSRAIDFLEPKEINGKRAAIIDDAVFTGKTINALANDLAKKGLSDVGKYAFALFDSEEAREYRHIDGINFSTILKKEQLENLIEELSQLSLKFRPSNPDHLLFSAYLRDNDSAEALLDISKYAGYVVEYKRHPMCKTWSVHYPSWSPEVDTRIARDSCSNKIRFNVDASGHVMRISAQYFPSLLIAPDLSVSDPLWRESEKILSKPWQDGEVKTRNLYESFSLSTRLRQARNLISDIGKCGIALTDFRMEMPRLEQYFGKRVAIELESLWKSYAGSADNQANVILLKDDATGNAVYPDDIQSLTKDLMRVLDSNYREENKSEKNL